MKFNKFDIIVNSGSADTFWFYIFSKYSDNIFKKNINKNYVITPYSENNIKFDLINKNFNIEYNGYSIKIIFDEFNENDLDQLDNRFYLSCDYLYDFDERVEDINNYNKIYYSIEEIPFTNEKEKLVYEFIRNADNFSLITSTNLKLNNPKVLYDYKISLVYFYYILGIYHLPFDDINVSKKHILGSYYRKGYRQNRDEFFNKICKLLDIEIYSVDYLKDDSVLFDLKYMDGWYGNHISSYLDYLKSVCNIMVESEETESTNLYYHCTEKTLKAILFSKLNIFFIYYANHNLIKELVNDGYWFLNFEFLDITNITEKSVDDSIEKTIEYLKNLEHEFKDYNLIYAHLVNKFGKKLKNNYEIFMNMKNSTHLTDKILDFVIYKFNKGKNII